MGEHVLRLSLRSVVLRFCRARSGAAAIEFAILMPILGLILAAAIDFGSLIFAKSRIEAAVSGSANLAIVRATQVSEAGSTQLAQTLAAYIGGSGAVDEATVTVNAGPSSRFTGSSVTTSGAASAAGSCYCPTVNADGSVAWGGAAACGTACGGGGFAGRFVAITASRAYSPLFSNYGVVSNGDIVVNTIVQAE